MKWLLVGFKPTSLWKNLIACHSSINPFILINKTRLHIAQHSIFNLAIKKCTLTSHRQENFLLPLSFSALYKILAIVSYFFLFFILIEPSAFSAKSSYWRNLQENFCAVNFLTAERNFHLSGLSSKKKRKFQQWNQQKKIVVYSGNFTLDDDDFQLHLRKFSRSAKFCAL